eukprot:gene1765-22877_t
MPHAGSGELLCGDLGCARLLRYSFVGHAATWAHAAERLASRWEAAAAVNAPVKRDAETSFYFRLRSVATMAKRGHAGQRPGHVWEIVAEQAEQQAGIEWLYAIEQAEAADVWRHYNLAHAAFSSGQYPAAEQRIADGRLELPAAGADGARAASPEPA